MTENEGLSITELARRVNGKVLGDPAYLIYGVSGVSESTAETITFAETEQYLSEALKSKAGAVIVPDGFTAKGKNMIVVKKPRLAFARIAAVFAPNVFYRPGIDPTSTIADSVVIGENVSIHPYVVIDEGAEIADHVILAPGVYIGAGVKVGESSILHPGVVVEYDTVIGKKVMIHSGTVIGSDGYGFVTDQDGHHKIPQLGKVIIEDDVEIGANVTIDRGTSGPTVIGRGTKTDNLIQLAHNVQIGEENLLVAQVGIAGSSKTGRRVILGGKTGVVGHLEIGDNTTVASASVITKDTPSGVFYSGSPAQDHKKELREQAARRKMPQLLKRISKLEKRIGELEKKLN